MPLRYFRQHEFMMGNTNVYHMMDNVFLNTLDQLRHNVGEPLNITSSYRSPEYNASLRPPGAKRSMHLQGRAVDISCDDAYLRRYIVMEALELGLTVGVANTFIHVDDRDSPLLFTY